MIDWQDKVGRTTLICAASGQPIPAGSALWSALTFRDGQFVRLDFLPEHWEGYARDGLLSWWRHQLPLPKQESLNSQLDLEGLGTLFRDLAPSTERRQQILAYVIALLLLRAKRLRFHGVERSTPLAYLVYQDRDQGRMWRLRDPQPSAEETAVVQDELLAIMGYPS